MRRALILMVLALGLAASRLPAAEQTVTPVAPPVEQRVKVLDPSETQRVEMIDAGTGQDVGAVVPPGPFEKAASTTGKVAVGFLGVVVTIAVMAAQILFM